MVLLGQEGSRREGDLRVESEVNYNKFGGRYGVWMVRSNGVGEAIGHLEIGRHRISRSRGQAVNYDHHPKSHGQVTDDTISK